MRRIRQFSSNSVKKEMESHSCDSQADFNIVGSESPNTENQMKNWKYFSQLLNLQNHLNQELFTNVRLMDLYLKNQEAVKIKKTSSQRSTQSNACKKNQPIDDLKMVPIKVPSEAKVKCSQKERRRDDSDYEPSSEVSDQNNRPKLSETKNIPKNYANAIISYIRKYQQESERVLSHLGINSEQFFEYIIEYRQKMCTIADLRSLWLEQGNPYAKAFRILSMKYLRKHSFSHIFNSRVHNHGKHIKYRYKIMNGLQNPLQFTQIKDF